MCIVIVVMAAVWPIGLWRRGDGGGTVKKESKKRSKQLRITAAVAKVTPEMLRSVWQETDYRWEVCRITNGSHIEP